jgi:hypothetical protein
MSEYLRTDTWERDVLCYTTLYGLTLWCRVADGFLNTHTQWHGFLTAKSEQYVTCTLQMLTPPCACVCVPVCVGGSNEQVNKALAIKVMMQLKKISQDNNRVLRNHYTHTHLSVFTVTMELQIWGLNQIIKLFISHTARAHCTMPRGKSRVT